MSITSVRDNENIRWKKYAKKPKKKKKQTKTEKSKGVTEAILQGWELIDFIVHLS